MAADGHIVYIVGSGIAGLRASKAILKSDFPAQVCIIGEESYRTYHRPGLSKRPYAAGDLDGSTIIQDLEIKDIDYSSLTWRLGTKVERSDLRNKTLYTSAGETLHYDSLIIATGVRARKLGTEDSNCAVHKHRTLRSIEDARFIHSELETGGTVTIEGAGFVACELASLAKAYGCQVVMVEAPGHGPFEGVLGKRISAALRYWLTANGIMFLPGKRHCSFLSPSPSGAATQISNVGSSLFVEAIGSVPNIEWLEGNGLDLSDGVRVDEYMRVPQCEDVFAAGDVARYPDPWAYGCFTRMEYWKNAIDTGDLAGRALASSFDLSSGLSSIKYFPNTVTEVCGLRIQIAGNPRASDTTEVICGDIGRLDNGVVVSFLRGKETVGVAYIGMDARYNRVYLRVIGSMRKPRT